MRILNGVYEAQKNRGEIKEQAEILISIASIELSQGDSIKAIERLQRARSLLLTLGNKAIERRQYVDRLLFWQYIENSMVRGTKQISE